MSKYYEIERVADKVMDDKIMHTCLYQMAGTMRTPDLVALTRKSDDHTPIVYYCHIEDILNSPVRERKGKPVTVYSYCPQDRHVMESLKKIGVTRYVAYSQFFKSAPSPKSLEFDPNLWYLMYGTFRDTCKEFDIELHVTRLGQGSRFICPIHDESSARTAFLTSAMKYVPFSQLLGTDYQFPENNEVDNKWAITSEEFIFDHIRKEEVQLLSDKDARFIHGYTEIEATRYLVGSTLKSESRNAGRDTWDALKYRRLVKDREARGLKV